MKLLVRAVMAQMLCVMLLLPVNLKPMDPPPMMGNRPEGPPPSMGFRSERRESMPSDMMHRPFEQPHMPEERPPMEDRSDMSRQDSASREHENVPTQVVSGIDTDFKTQETIDNAVDTINAKSGGNWLLKRVWWEKTEEIYEQIKEVFNRVMDTRMRFISDYNKLNRSLDIFYSEVGIEQGPLRDLLSHAQDLINKEEKEQGYLNKREQAFVFKLKGKERDLEQLKLDVKAIQELDAKLDEAFEVLFKQIDVCNQYEQKAWDNFKEIARELNDKEARKLYYDTEGLYKDIKKVSGYISGEFASYFDQTIQSAHDHTSKISAQMNTLKNEGIDLVKQAEILEKDEEPAPKKTTKKVKQKAVSNGWWYKLGEHVGKFIDMVVSWIPKPVRVWFGKEDKQVDAEYEKLKKDSEKYAAPVEKEIDKIEKSAEPDIQSIEKSAQADMKMVEKEAQKIEKSVFGELTTAQKKELGLDETSKQKPHTVLKQHNSVQHQALSAMHPPAMPPHALPTPPERNVSHAPPPMKRLQEQPRPRRDHAREHVEHRPLHMPPSPRRSITDHFESPRSERKEERHASPQHNFYQHAPSQHEQAPLPPSPPKHHSERMNALQPGTLGS